MATKTLIVLAFCMIATVYVASLPHSPADAATKDQNSTSFGTGRNPGPVPAFHADDSTKEQNNTSLAMGTYVGGKPSVFRADSSSSNQDKDGNLVSNATDATGQDGKQSHSFER